MDGKKYSLGTENEQIEFKKSTGELKEAVISIVAILNKHQSGKLYFGVKNDGTVIGQDINDTTLRTISQAIGNHIYPTIYPTINRQDYGDKAVVEVEFSGNQQPYLAYNIPRIRVADEDLVMEQPIYDELIRKRDNINYSWESQKSKYTIADIDQNMFKSYLRKAKKVGRISFENDKPTEVMIKLGLVEDDILLNAGAALFVDCGINELQMAKFASDERLTFTDIRRFTGSILDLSDKAVQYVIDAMDWRVEFDGSLERKEIPEIPVDAVREAVINAFAHRLIESGQSVEVAVYRSFIEIYSPGKFPDGMTPEMFIKDIRKPIRRNPLITRTLYYSKDMESFATGMKRIQDACDEAGCKVEYYGDEYGFTVRFYRHCGEGWGTNEYGKVENNKTTNSKVTNSKVTNSKVTNSKVTNSKVTNSKVTNSKVAKSTSDSPIEIATLKLIKENTAITIPQLAEKLSINSRTVQRVINSLKIKGIIERKGGKRYGHWEIKN